jgi:sporulation protein YlmC with PRC-barrel domain
MLVEITELFGIKVYSHKGTYIGDISDIIIDFDRGSIYGVYLEKSNPDLVENGAAISIPFRMVKSVDEIMLLKNFPEKVKVKSN